jgi:hypothetical protein
MGVIGHLGAAPAPRVMVSGLSTVAGSYSFRCDAKQAEHRFQAFDTWIAGVPHFLLGDVLPEPIVKGAQPGYSDAAGATITVITTMAIQNLAIDPAGCRPAIAVDYGPAQVRKPKAEDVLLTVDGGTSIGKPVLFDLVGDYAVDSHVAILRPDGLDPSLLVHLLASPLGQLQFQRSESGASGQTAVTEEDIRRFRFPLLDPVTEAKAIGDVRLARQEAQALREQAVRREEQGWEDFLTDVAPGL